MQPDAAVREGFREQARWCEQLGSPFTARICAATAEILDPDTPLGARLLEWPGDTMRDALPLRLTGGLHALVRAGEAPDLARLYPPAPPPSDEALRAALARTISEQAAALDPWLDTAPQTNEVGRSALLMSGLLVIAERFGLPLRLFELGASAGLNLQLDRYCYDLGGLQTGEPGSRVRLKPDWKGPPPPSAQVRIAGRSAVDLNPIDPITERERLIAYLWPDQEARLARFQAALDIAALEPPLVTRGDAADWLEAQLAAAPESGVCRVVLHSVAYQYFPPATRQRIRARIDGAGAVSHADAPLAWLRFEMMAGEAHFSLRLRTWPGEEKLLAWSHPHGSWTEWVA